MDKFKAVKAKYQTRRRNMSRSVEEGGDHFRVEKMYLDKPATWSSYLKTCCRGGIGTGQAWIESSYHSPPVPPACLAEFVEVRPDSWYDFVRVYYCRL